MEKERLDYIDVVKGLSIISIVLLHYENGLLPDHINAYIGEYMITAFYVAVGWINATRTKEITTRELLSKRWVQIGKPYLYWSAIIIIFDIILMLFGHCDTYSIAKDCYKTAVLRGIGTLWFLPALMGGELLWNWTKKKNSKVLYLLTLIIIIAYQSAVTFFFKGKEDSMSRIINAPFQTLYSMGDAWIGIAFGFAMYKLFSNFLRERSAITILIAGLLISQASFLLANNYPLPFGEKYFAPFIEPLGLFFIFKAIKIPFVSKYLTYWGINSLGLMVIHFSILLVICTLIQNKIDGTTGQELYGWTAIIHFVITMIVSYFIIEGIKKIYPPLLGKKQ